MNKDEMRVAIAEHLGWEMIPGERPSSLGHLIAWKPDGKTGFIPNWPECLNAIHEAKRKLLTDSTICAEFNRLLMEERPMRSEIKNEIDKWTWGVASLHYIEAVKSSPAVPVKAGDSIAQEVECPYCDTPIVVDSDGNVLSGCKHHRRGSKIDMDSLVSTEPSVADSQRETPRMDAESYMTSRGPVVRADFARTLERELAEAKPWMLFFRDGKSLGEIAEQCGGSVYDYSQPMTAACLRVCRDDDSKLIRELAAAMREGGRVSAEPACSLKSSMTR